MPAYSIAVTRAPRSTTRVLFLRKEGETLQFLSTAHETRYQCSEMIFSIPPGQKPPAMHRHPHQTERVEVLSGDLELTLPDGRRRFSEGDLLTIAKGSDHAFGNASPMNPLTVKVSFEPALNIEWYFTQMACSAIRNGGRWKNVPWLEAATIHYALRREYRLARIPHWLQDLCFGSLTLLARITGAVRNIRPLSLHAVYVR